MDNQLSITIQAGSSLDKYPSKAHAQCVADKLGLDTGLIVLKGEKDENFSNSDQPRPFRQDRYFYYFTGCEEPGCYATYDIGKDKLTLWLPRPSLERVFYDGRGSTPEEAMEKYDVDEARYMRDRKPKERLAFMIKKHVEDGGVWAFNKFPRGVLKRNLWTEKVDVGLNKKLRRVTDQSRAVKDAHEIELIRKANAVSSAAHIEVLKRLPTLKAETEVEAVYTGVCLAQGAKKQAYDPICGAGANAGQLHYSDNNADFGDAQVLLIDAGAEWKCHASDVTRSMPINSGNPGHWPSKEAEQIYNAVATIQDNCIRKMRPGNRFININWHAQHMTLHFLLKLGILKGEHMDIFHAGTFAAFFPHGLGHHLGLEVHDVQPVVDRESKDWTRRFAQTAGAYRCAFDPNGPNDKLHEMYAAAISCEDSKNPKDFGLNPSFCMTPNTPEAPPLEPGNVVTIEPGIYFNRFILDNFYLNNDKHRKFIDVDVLGRYMHVGGVRIEDDILITKDGYENLTTTPKGEEAFKIIREAAKKLEAGL